MKNKQVTTKLFLDKRYKKDSGTYPVLLRITFNRKSAYLPAGKAFNFNDKQWEKMLALKDFKEEREKLVVFEKEVAAIIDSIPAPKFTLKEFRHQWDKKDEVLAADAHSI